MTHRLGGFTFVRELSLDVDLRTGAYTLRLVLSESEQPSARTLIADFETVSGLSIADFGGGWTQFLYLAIEDVSAQQHDRVHYRVRDSDNDRISFACERLQISDPTTA
jgi:hypothetical protein